MKMFQICVLAQGKLHKKDINGKDINISVLNHIVPCIRKWNQANKTQ